MNCALNRSDLLQISFGLFLCVEFVSSLVEDVLVPFSNLFWYVVWLPVLGQTPFGGGRHRAAWQPSGRSRMAKTQW